MIQVFQYPHKTLNEVSSDWNKEDSINGYNDIEKFEYDMIKLMIESRGMGLAANQIGITKRFFAIGSETFDKLDKDMVKSWSVVVKQEVVRLFCPKCIKKAKEVIFNATNTED